MQDRMALCFHRFSWVNHRLIAFLFLLCFLENIHSQTFGCTFWVQRSRSILGILGLEQWLGRQCCLGWPVENSGKLTLSLVIKNRIQMASRGAEGNNDRHQQAFVRKNQSPRRMTWSPSNVSWNTRWEADQLVSFLEREQRNGHWAIVFEDRHPLFSDGVLETDVFCRSCLQVWRWMIWEVKNLFT